MSEEVPTHFQTSEPYPKTKKGILARLRMKGEDGAREGTMGVGGRTSEGERRDGESSIGRLRVDRARRRAPSRPRGGVRHGPGTCENGVGALARATPGR